MIVEPERPSGPGLPKAGDARSAATDATARRAASFLRIEGNIWDSGDVAELDRVGDGSQLLQALVLDLADPLARDVERPPDLVEGARMLPVEPVAKLQHLPLAARERAEDLPQRLLAQRDLRLFVRQRQGLVGDEMPELRLVLLPHRLLQRDPGLRGA